MAQYDLGRATFRLRGSHLQLQLAATAQLHQLQNEGQPKPQRAVSWVSDLDGIWITELPEMRLRFFVRCDRRLNDVVNTLITGLRDNLCGLKESFYSSWC